MPSLTTVNVICPHCDGLLVAHRKMMGKHGKCPSCGQAVPIVPETKEDQKRVVKKAERRASPAQAMEGAEPSTAYQGNMGMDPSRVPAGQRMEIIEVLAGYRPIERFAENVGPNVFATVFGFDIGWKQLSIAAAVLVILGSLGGWIALQYARGRPYVAMMSEVQTVDAYEAMRNLRFLQPPRYIKPQIAGNGLAGLDDADGGGLSSTPAPAVAAAASAITVSGDQGLVITHPSSSGEFIMMEVAVSSQLYNTYAEVTPAGTELKAEHFQLIGGQGASIATFLLGEMPNQLKIDLTQANATDGYAALPPGPDPSKEVKKGSGYSITYAGEDQATGQVDISASNGAIDAVGEIRISTSRGVNLAYEYKGKTMKMYWDPASRGWHHSTVYMEPRGAAVTGDRRFMLLFPRPLARGSGRLELHLGGEKMRTLPGGMTIER